MIARSPNGSLLLAVAVTAALATGGCSEIENDFVAIGAMRVLAADPSLTIQSLDGDGVQYAEFRFSEARATLPDGTAIDLLGGAGDCRLVDFPLSAPVIESGVPCARGIVVAENDSPGTLVLDVTLTGSLRRIEPLMLDRNGDDDWCTNADGSVPTPEGTRCPDGVPNFIDKCPLIPDPGQEDEDQDGIGDACQALSPATGRNDRDSDGDSFIDLFDNCIYLANSGQNAPYEINGIRYGIPPPPECSDQVATITLDGNPAMTLHLEFPDFTQAALAGSNLLLDLDHATTLACNWELGECALDLEALEVCVKSSLTGALVGC